MQRVSIVKVEQCNFDRAVASAVDLAGGFGDLIKPDSRVVVKPNMMKPVPSGTGVITDARLTEAVTKLVLDMRPASVVIAEGTAAGYDDGASSTEEAFNLSGTTAVAQRLGVPCVYLNRDEAVAVEVPNPRAMDRILLARTAYEADVLISVPVLKTHPRCNATIALKNLWGVPPGTEKRAGHMLGINDALVDMLSVIRPTYSIVDANVASQGVWRVPEDSRVLGLLLAGKDALATDVVGCALMGVDPESVYYLRELMRMEGEVRGLEDIEVVGESIIDHAERFKTAFEVVMEMFPGVTVVAGDLFCSGCVAELLSALRHMKGAGYEKHMDGLTIVVGNPEDYEVSGKVAVIGGCSEDVDENWPTAGGCPPAEDDVFAALCEACGAELSLVLSVRDEFRRDMWESTMHLISQ